MPTLRTYHLVGAPSLHSMIAGWADTPPKLYTLPNGHSTGLLVPYIAVTDAE